MRRPINFLNNLVSGIALGAVGVCLAIWVGIALYKVEWAFDLVLLATKHSPFPLDGISVQLANDAVQDSSQVAVGVVAAVLCIMAIQSMRFARLSMRPINESHDGRVRVEFKAEHPRVGRPLEGSLWLKKDAKPGEMFCVELTCMQCYYTTKDGAADNQYSKAFFAKQEVQAVQGSEGWNVPFRFDVPVTAPPSTQGFKLSRQWTYGWSLGIYPANAQNAHPSGFELTLAPAPDEELRAIEARESPEQKAAIKAIETVSGVLLPHQRLEVRALSPENLAMAQKVAGMPLKILKWMFIAFIVLNLIIFGIGALMYVVAALFSS